MKACLNCGLEAPDDAIACPACGRSFAFVAGAAPATKRAERPNGGTPMTIGQILIVVGIVLYVVGLSGSDLDSGGDRLLSQTSVVGLLGLSIIPLGVLLWATGYVVHALSFLPGRDR